MTEWEFWHPAQQYSLDAVNWRNLYGNPVLYADVLSGAEGDNQRIAGVFRITLMDIDQCMCEAVHFGDYHSPVLWDGIKEMVADGTTVNANLVPGIGITLSGEAIEGDQFEIGIGCYWDAVAGTWFRGLPMDLLVSGYDSAERRLAIRNVSGRTQCNCVIVGTNAMRLENDQTASRPFAQFRQVGMLNPTADTDASGTQISFADLVEGTPNTVSILVAGLPANIYDVANDTMISSGIGLLCDGSTVYRFPDGYPNQGGEFVLSPDLEVTDTATLFVSDGGDFLMIAAYDGDFVPGTSGIWITSSGAPEGVVAADSTVEFRIKLASLSEADLSFNPRLFSLRVQSNAV